MKTIFTLLLLPLAFSVFSQTAKVTQHSGSYVNLIQFKNKLYFTEGDSLFQTVGDDHPVTGIAAGFDNPSNFQVIGEHLIFKDETGFWISDGTTTGTHYLGAFSKVEFPTLLNNKIIFWASGIDISNTEPYVTNGHEASLLKDINAGTGNSFVSDLASSFKTGTTKAYFVANDEVHGNELWVTDGTASGTKIVGDLIENKTYAWSTFTEVVDDKIYFFLNVEDGFDLMVSDGTEAGTEILNHMVTSIWGDEFIWTPVRHGGIGHTNTKLIFETASLFEDQYSVEIWGYNFSTEVFGMIKTIPYEYEFEPGFSKDAFNFSNEVVFAHAIDIDYNEFYGTDGSTVTSLFSESINPQVFVEDFYKLGNKWIFTTTMEQGTGSIYEIKGNEVNNIYPSNTFENELQPILVSSDRYFLLWDFPTMDEGYNKFGPKNLRLFDLQTGLVKDISESLNDEDSTIVAAAQNFELLENNLYFTSGNNIYTLDISSIVTNNSPALQQINLQVFPNPFSEELTIKIPSGQEVSLIKVKDVLGNTVAQVDLKLTEERINLAPYNLPSGVYFIDYGKGDMIKIIKN